MERDISTDMDLIWILIEMNQLEKKKERKWDNLGNGDLLNLMTVLWLFLKNTSFLDTYWNFMGRNEILLEICFRLSDKGVKGGVLLLTITEHGQYAVHVS